ncbi:MAG: LacI family DNA-binding transcriptional regulator [Leeuwenhoekiella sp.]
MRRKLTLKLIAQELDVSISTVSKALRDSSEIGAETREKIKAYAKRYNYKPNNIALSLKNRKTNTIGVIIPQIVHHFFTTVVRGIEETARERNYNVIICLSNNDYEREKLNLDLLANGSTDGFIMSVAQETLQKGNYEHITEVIEQGMPIVMFDRVVDEVACDRVLIDDRAGAKKGVNHLLNTGCKKIGIITTQDFISVGKLRTEGYREALRDAGMEVNEDYILKLDAIDDVTQENQQIIKRFIKEHDLDGIFTVNEMFSVYSARVIKEIGKSIPDDISLVCFTNGNLSQHFLPSLSVISQHGQQMGRRAAEMLINKLEKQDGSKEDEYQTSYIDTSLIIRESTKS